MRDRAIDEFEAIFERAAVPVLDIQPLRLPRLSAVLMGDALDASILALAMYLRERFSASLRLHWPTTVADAVRAAIEMGGLKDDGDGFHSTAELIGQIGLTRSRLVLISDPPGAESRIVNKDDLVRGSSPPILIVHNPIAQPARVFAKILHSLTGNFKQTENFSYSFGLAEPGGEVLLLHTIAKGELTDVRETLKLSSEIDEQERDEVLARLGRHGDRYLRGVIAAAHESSFDVSYRLEVGKIGSTVQAELQGGGYSLLVVGNHEEGFSQISAEDYQLMHEVRDVPVLAL
jgi:hypothetical protein